MVNPTELHGEIPSANREQQRLTLGSGECLEAAVEKTVKQLDPVMNTQQVTSTVAVLMNDIQAEAPTANLRTVSPGVSVLIVRQRTATGVVWDAVLGKYSGIT